MHRSMFRIQVPLLIFAGLALQAGAALAQSQSPLERMSEHLGPVSVPSGGEFFRSGTYIDFSSTSADPNRAWKTWTVSNNTVVKYASLVIYGQGLTNSSNPPECIEAYTEQGSSTTSGADTRMYIRDANASRGNPAGGVIVASGSTYTSISDDWGGTLYSRVRVFWGGPTSGTPEIAIRTSPFSTSLNSIDFGITWRRLNYTTSDDCRTQGLSAPTNFVDASVNPPRYTITTSL
jgi:hypothetical protein